jgi:hypothetical protein
MIAALAPAGAQAYPLWDGPSGGSPDPDPNPVELTVPPTRTIVAGGSDSIDWADASAGFAAAACLSLLAVGTVAAIRRPRGTA